MGVTATICFCLLLVALFGVSRLHSARPTNRLQYRNLVNNMNPTADPCQDYYQYACGNWKFIHNGKKYDDTIGYIDLKVDSELGIALNRVRKQSKYRHLNFVRSLHNYYRSCRAVRQYKPDRYLELLQIKEGIEWPQLMPSKKYDGDDSNQYDWLHLLAVLRKYGLNGIFIEEMVTHTPLKPRIWIIDIDKPVMNGGFDPMSYEGFSVIMYYMGVPTKIKTRLWREIIEFEAVLYQITNEEDDQEQEARIVSLQDIDMPWLNRYLSIVLEHEVDPNMKINFQSELYFVKLFLLIELYEPEFLYRYIMIRFLWYLNVSGPTDFFKHTCLLHMRGSMPLASAWLYEEYRPELLEEKTNVLAIFDKLIEHIKTVLASNVNNFDESILKFLDNKISKIKIKINNLPRPNTAQQLEQYYENLFITADDFYTNHLNLLYFISRAEHNELNVTWHPERTNYIHFEDPETGSSSSPYFLLLSNLIVLPLTVLNMPVYHRNLHEVFQFSTLGFLLAHEISHGFDDSGIYFDGNGLKRGPSRRIKTNRLFDSNLQCLSNNNPNIIDEKIADVSGLRWAYETYFMNNSLANEQPSWSTFSTPELFFLNFAQFFCSNSARDSPHFIDHGPDDLRVIDTLAHFSEFGRVYNCTAGSPMNPKKKCQLW